MRKGILLILSGFAGSGKGTIVKELIKRYDNYALSVSATTRAPRPGEVEGRDYFFKTREEFEEMIARDDFLEHAEYVGNYYGTPRQYVDDMLDKGMDVILEIEMQGALLVKERCPEAALMFVMPPSAGEVYNRLKKRGTESEEVILKRMKRGAEESRGICKYDFLIINDDLEKCIEEVNNTVQCAKCATLRNRDAIDTIIKEFDDFLMDKEEG